MQTHENSSRVPCSSPKLFLAQCWENPILASQALAESPPHQTPLKEPNNSQLKLEIFSQQRAAQSLYVAPHTSLAAVVIVSPISPVSPVSRQPQHPHLVDAHHRDDKDITTFSGLDPSLLGWRPSLLGLRLPMKRTPRPRRWAVRREREEGEVQGVPKKRASARRSGEVVRAGALEVG